MSTTKKQNIYEKLSLVKAEVGRISKDSNNPFFKSKYFDVNSLLLHVEPIIQKHGLLLLQPIQDNLVKSVIFDTDGVCIESSIPLPDLNDPQKLGSAITYYRRYTLQSLLALQAEDDDANLASGKVQQSKPQTPQPTPQAKPKLTDLTKVKEAMKKDKEGTIKLLEKYDLTPQQKKELGL